MIENLDTTFMDHEYIRVPIKSIKKVKNKQLVYDLSVEDYHTYCVSAVDIVGHNSDMGKRAQEIGQFFRTFDVAFEKSNITFLFTNKLYTNIGNKYVPWKETGGQNAEYNPSLSVMFSDTAETDDKTDAEIKSEKERRKSSLGASLKTIRGTITKSRFGTANRNAWFIFDMAVGPVRHSGLFTLFKDFGIITGNRNYTVEGWNNDKSFYKKDFLKIFLQNEEGNIDYFQNRLEVKEAEIKEVKRKMIYQDIDDTDVGETEDVDNELIDMVSAMEKDVK